MIPEEERLKEPRRERPWQGPRGVLNGVLWILRTSATWQDLPERYPPYQTCHRRFQKWVGKGSKVMAMADRAGLPLAVCVTSASLHEATLVETTVQSSLVAEKPLRLIGDRTYDSDPMNERLAEEG